MQVTEASTQSKCTIILELKKQEFMETQDSELQMKILTLRNPPNLGKTLCTSTGVTIKQDLDTSLLIKKLEKKFW